MKLPLAAAMAATLWAMAGTPYVVHAQVLPSSGPGSTIPISPDDTPLVRRPDDHPLLRATGLITAMPGPYLPNPDNPLTRVRVSPDRE
jgi:hypothetical protein